MKTFRYIRESLKKKYIDFRNISEEKISESLPSKGLYFQTFHSIEDSERDHFRNILEFYSQYFKFISYSEAVQRLTANEIDARYICISADDGFRNFKVACEIFDEYDIKAIVFVNPGIIGETDREVIRQHCKVRLGKGLVDFLNWNELEDLLSDGHEVGNHGRIHLNLTKCDTAMLNEEIQSSKEILDSRLGKVTHYAWTYGKLNFINPEALNCIYSSGHTSAAGVVRGYHSEAIVDLRKDNNYIKRDVFEPTYSMSMISYFLYQAMSK